MPTELLLGSVASCFTLAIAHVARKHQKRIEDLVVTAEGEYDGPRFSRVVLGVSAGIPEEDIEWLAARAIRVCYVSNTLGCNIDYKVS